MSPRTSSSLRGTLRARVLLDDERASTRGNVGKLLGSTQNPARYVTQSTMTPPVALHALLRTCGDSRQERGSAGGHRELTASTEAHSDNLALPSHASADPGSPQAISFATRDCSDHFAGGGKRTERAAACNGSSEAVSCAAVTAAT